MQENWAKIVFSSHKNATKNTEIIQSYAIYVYVFRNTHKLKI